MAHFAIVCPDEAGHLLSIGPVGQELARRGHRVTVVAPQWAMPLAKLLDLPLHLLDSDPVAFRSSWLLERAARLGGVSGYVEFRDYFRWQAEVVLTLVPGALRELAVDGVLVDHVLLAGGTAAERAGVPFVTTGSAMFWNEEPGVPPFYTTWSYSPGPFGEWRNCLGYAGWHWFLQPTLNLINRRRKKWGLSRFQRIDDTYSPLAQIAQLCPEFDLPRRQLPDTFHYVGSFTADRQLNSDHNFPWERLDGRPLVFASLGTVFDPSNARVFPRILSACAGLDAQLVLALGKWHDETADDEEKEWKSIGDQLGAIPDNAVVVDFAPQLALLDRAALLITHAGVNTVLEALSRAVPMVALPRSLDQPAMGARIAHSGVGLLGSFRSSTSAQIREMVERVLGEDGFRQRGRDLQTAMRAAGGLTRAADIAEQALTTRRPVRSESAPCPARQADNHIGVGVSAP